MSQSNFNLSTADEITIGSKVVDEIKIGNKIVYSAGMPIGSTFMRKVTAGGTSIKDGKAKVQTIYGNTIVFNQLVDAATSSVTLAANHYYLLSDNGTDAIAKSDGTAIAVIGGEDNLFDLTKMFSGGEAAALGVANLDTAENRDTAIVNFRKIFPSTYTYNAGELLPFTSKPDESIGGTLVKGARIESRGFNLWDNADVRLFNAYIYYKNVTTSTWRSASDSLSLAVKVTPCTAYFIHHTAAASPTIMRIGQLNQDLPSGTFSALPLAKTFNYMSQFNDVTFLTIAGAKWLIIQFGAIWLRQNRDKICVSISNASLNGTFKPYMQPSEVKLPIAANNQPLILRSVGSIKDEVRGTRVIRKVGNRAYQSGDEDDVTLLTDGITTNYPLVTHTEETIPAWDNDYIVENGGEELLLPDNEVAVNCAPINATIKYKKPATQL